eukprot:CAMPEP_0183502296 /NCGR_PEP_ID=MMETSP0371-20130417/4143_1 /TAXON_ID=268820 /ORGANISM="Peridinium aciculiferum, Strain PAER-2" /LENGTH=190 /DNA_ID=CAMNT_0025696981 /DNA_START=170 /DNA_END=740 /DNA_ORIENTATION=+
MTPCPAGRLKSAGTVVEGPSTFVPAARLACISITARARAALRDAPQVAIDVVPEALATLPRHARNPCHALPRGNAGGARADAALVQVVAIPATLAGARVARSIDVRCWLGRLARNRLNNTLALPRKEAELSEGAAVPPARPSCTTMANSSGVEVCMAQILAWICLGEVACGLSWPDWGGAECARSLSDKR